MALVECKECKATVSDKAEICPKCGIKYPGILSSKITVTRASAFKGLAVGMQIIIGDLDLGVFKPGREITIEIPPGRYRVKAANSTFRAGHSGIAEIVIEPAQEYVLIAKFVAYSVGFEFKKK